MIEFLKKAWDWAFHPNAARAYEGDYITVKLGDAGVVTLNVNVDITKANKQDRDFISDLIEKMQRQKGR